ncbi:kinase-like domain-containing protein [Mycena sanguinolenta]|nr:kinase-like domain-containing protein [Mycena sanguinolenta]
MPFKTNETALRSDEAEIYQEEIILPVFRDCISSPQARSKTLTATCDDTLLPQSSFSYPAPFHHVPLYPRLTVRMSHGIPTPVSEIPSSRHGAATPSNEGGPEEICYGDPVFSFDQPPDSIILDDKYPISSGGSCNIYRGSFQLNGRRLSSAIKLIRTSSDKPQLDAVRKRLDREGNLWKKIKHPNILPFLGVHEIGASIPALVSPYCKFGHIETYLSNHPKANRNELVHGVAAGLEFLHSQNIIHGDIKRENVLVDKRCVPCICDFGISRILDCTGFTTRTVGTYSYMAPELFFLLDGSNNEPSRTTKSSDIYSFALLALEILADQRIKDRPTRYFLWPQDLERHRPSLTDYNVAHISDAMLNVLQQCWETDPRKRPSMIDMLASPAFRVPWEPRLPLPSHPLALASSPLFCLPAPA